MNRRYAKGTRVEWDWVNITDSGTIREVFTSRVDERVGGYRVIRRATESEPAYLIQSEAGEKVLKSHAEVRQRS